MKPFANKLFILIIGLIIISVCVIYVITKGTARQITENASFYDSCELTHSIVAKCHFDPHEINVGYMIDYFPSNLIMKIMDNDLVLKDKLNVCRKKIRFYPFSSQEELLYHLNSGDICCAVLDGIGTLISASQNDVVVPSFSQYGFEGVIANKTQLNKRLRKTRVGYCPGTVDQYVLSRAVSVMGIDGENIRWIDISNDKAIELLKSGQIEMVTLKEPYLTYESMSNDDLKIIYKQFTSGYLFFSKRFYDRNLSSVYHILSAHIRAIQYLRDDSGNLFPVVNTLKENIEKVLNKKITLSVDQIHFLAVNDILGIGNCPLIDEKTFSIGSQMHKIYLFLYANRLIDPDISWDKIKSCFNSESLKYILSRETEFDLNKYIYSRDKLHDGKI